MITAMIVDDSKVIHKILGNLLKNVGIEKCYDDLFNGAEALKCFNDNQSDIDIILTDWNMPVMNGLDFVKAVRNKNKTIPIWMITTEGGKGEVVQALKAGVNNYIVKPIDREIIERKLKEQFPELNA